MTRARQAAAAAASLFDPRARRAGNETSKGTTHRADSRAEGEFQKSKGAGTVRRHRQRKGSQRRKSKYRYIGQVPCHHNHCAVTHEAASHQERNIINKVTLVRRFSLELTLFSCPAPLILSSDTNSGITFHCSACGKVLLYCTGIGGRDY